MYLLYNYHYPYFSSSYYYVWIYDYTLELLFLIEFIKEPGSTFYFGISSSNN